jgi:hypothetical protein
LEQLAFEPQGPVSPDHLEAEQNSYKVVAEADQKALAWMIAAGAEQVHSEEQQQLKRAVPDPI